MRRRPRIACAEARCPRARTRRTTRPARAGPAQRAGAGPVGGDDRPCPSANGDSAAWRGDGASAPAAQRPASVGPWRPRRDCRRDARRALGTTGALAWRHTFTNRCTAVTIVSTSMTHSTGTSNESNSRPKPSSDDPLGALHEPAAGVEAERLGLGPLVGDEHRQREHGERQHRACGRRRPSRGTRRRRRAAARR